VIERTLPVPSSEPLPAGGSVICPAVATALICQTSSVRRFRREPITMNIPSGHLQHCSSRSMGARPRPPCLSSSACGSSFRPIRPVLSLRAEALRLADAPAEAIEAFRQAGAQGAGARCWLAAGILLAGERATEEALQCLLQAARRDSRQRRGVGMLSSPRSSTATAIGKASSSHGGSSRSPPTPRCSRVPHCCWQANDLYEESSEAFQKIVRMAPDDPALIGGALVPARFTCDGSGSTLCSASSAPGTTRAGSTCPRNSRSRT